MAFENLLSKNMICNLHWYSLALWILLNRLHLKLKLKRFPLPQFFKICFHAYFIPKIQHNILSHIIFLLGFTCISPGWNFLMNYVHAGCVHFLNGAAYLVYSNISVSPICISLFWFFHVYEHVPLFLAFLNSERKYRKCDKNAVNIWTGKGELCFRLRSYTHFAWKKSTLLLTANG